MNEINLNLERAKMVEDQLIANGIVHQDIIDAFLNIPRYKFVPEEYKEQSYNDRPLPIGFSQTISQPFVVAYMLQLLNLNSTHKVLEVGTGSGYQTALLCDMGCRVFSVELIEELSKRAEEVINSLGFKNVTFVIGDGHYGYKEGSHYDRIVVSAASETVPDSLIEQLNDQGGKLVLPVGNEIQRINLITKNGKEVKKKILDAVKFVPLIK